MANITVTYSFVNGTVADATEVNTNFSDILSGLSDGTKDLSVSAITAAGNVTFNANTQMGNATSDTITTTARLASDLDPNTDNARDFGAAGLAYKAIYSYDFFASLGAVGTPSYSFNNAGTLDSDTGMWSSAANTINFSAGGTEILEIDSTSIDATVNIITSTEVQGKTVRAIDSGAAAQINFGTSSGEGGHLWSNGVNRAGFLGSCRHNGTNYIATHTEASIALHEAGSFIVYTDTSLTDGNTFTPTERFRIYTNGYLGLGDAAPAVPVSTSHSIADVCARFDNSHGSTPYGQEIRFSGANPDNNTQYYLRCLSTSGGTTNHCYIMSDGDLQNADNSYGAISDERLKENIRDADSQWDDVKAFKWRKYKFKDAVRRGRGRDHLGVISQEIEQVSPGLISYNSDTDTYGVQYSILYMKVCKAFQEAQSRIEVLESKVEALSVA